MSDQFFERLVRALVPVVQEAGKAILAVREGGYEVDRKDDESPVTQADREAEAIILAALTRLAPDIPVVGEEAASEGHVPEIGQRFFLVDPLDGTKEFIAGRSEFTVNIALIEDARPVLGMVYAPMLKKLYLTPRPGQAALMPLDSEAAPVGAGGIDPVAIGCREASGSGLSVLASLSHMNAATEAFLEDIEVAEFLQAGSSLKFCLIAEGKADLYPRLAPTMEWDTAAGQAVLEAAGGRVEAEDGTPLVYGKSDRGFVNGGFIARGAGSA